MTNSVRVVPPKYIGLRRIIQAGSYSWKGLISAWGSEAAFRQECALALLIVPTMLLVDLNSIERIALVAVTVLVLVTELLNSAIETVVDRVGTEYHELSGKAKDIGSAAVLLSLCLWVYTWLELIFND